MSDLVLIDSPLANIANIRRALESVGANLTLSSDPEAIARGGKIVLPGVGSFKAGMSWLSERRIDRAILSAVEKGASVLGVCLGHQLLFESSEEAEGMPGLGLIPGAVRRFSGGLPVPQIGWNRVTSNGSKLFAGVASETPFYFVHSYRAEVADPRDAIGTAEYDGRYVAAAARRNVFGVQFHPEKSSAAGLRVLRNFVEAA